MSLFWGFGFTSLSAVFVGNYLSPVGWCWGGWWPPRDWCTNFAMVFWGTKSPWKSHEIAKIRRFMIIISLSKIHLLVVNLHIFQTPCEVEGVWYSAQQCEDWICAVAHQIPQDQVRWHGALLPPLEEVCSNLYGKWMPTGLTSLIPFKTKHILVPSCTPLLDRPKFQDG